MNINLNKVREHIELYFKENLPQYTVLEIRRKSSHPDDTHLFMVSAKKSNGTYSLWTGWNELSQSLNHGHYDLQSAEECEKLLEEYQNIHPYYEVYKYSQNAKFPLFVANTEESAKKFCEKMNWQFEDENGFIWDLDYSTSSTNKGV